MAGEYVSKCGCKIHVIQWSTKRKIVSQETCPLHKSAPDGLALAEMVIAREDNLRDTRISWIDIVAAARALKEKAGQCLL